MRIASASERERSPRNVGGAEAPVRGPGGAPGGSPLPAPAASDFPFVGGTSSARAGKASPTSRANASPGRARRRKGGVIAGDLLALGARPCGPGHGTLPEAASRPRGARLRRGRANVPARGRGGAASRAIFAAMRTVALVLAAGRGERLGLSLPKGFAPLAGRPLLLHALAALDAVAELERLVPVIPGDAVARYRAAIAGEGAAWRLAAPVVGGRERQDSVRAGLSALPPGTGLVAVHDAARPLVRPDAVRRVVEAAAATGAAILAAPVRDTIKRVVAGRVAETPPRAECWAAQTPQVFRVEILREALAKADAEGVVGTDDAQLVEALGVEVRVVPGDPDNLKITGPEDLALAERLLALRGGGVA